MVAVTLCRARQLSATSVAVFGSRCIACESTRKRLTKMPNAFSETCGATGFFVCSAEPVVEDDLAIVEPSVLFNFQFCEEGGRFDYVRLSKDPCQVHQI